MMRYARNLRLAMWAVLVTNLSTAAMAADLWCVYEGSEGAGKGKHIVLISGDEEYRSEEALPQLGKILARHHGFKCTVVFPIDAETGLINPDNRKNIPGLEALESADLMVIATRFRELPDDQMKFIDDYIQAGKPVVGMRTATHAFNNGGSAKYKNYHWRSGGEWKGGFGRYVLGETWINHHGHHGRQATRGILAKDQNEHPILRGIKDGDVFGPTDVYGVRLPLPGDSQPLVLGQVVAGMKLDDPALEGKKNDPMMPVAWTKTYTGKSGKSGRVFTTTMGSSTDLLHEGTRRMIVNGCYWAVGLEGKIPAKSKVDIVGKFETLPFKFGGFKRGVRPADHKLKK